ncbi:MFS transporter [Leadbetterella byssophila]|uniref:Major facilitator superfamily MFS_1 n=1 Tax=Leadbetterella byssophila (strain DSM 17132 / JCM 16389 / KACC 11308 / NBRC 106382 / 4M15) TaxID=649349 RepID=E4RY19_LEAB4|nr:MFS transporter [Leadbetterella byssophila]ADQ16347.1 major facilitator superfamily MFS_1 [Leadbetterella byssophila DSM 17132]
MIKYYIDSFRGLSKEVWMLALVILINRTSAMVVPFLGVYMTQALGFSLKETGVVLSFFGMGAVLGSYVGGRLTDIFGFYSTQLYSFLLTIPIFMILPELKTVYSLSIGVFVLSAVADAFRPANSVALSYYTPQEKITKAFSLNRMAVNLGFSIGPALGGFLAGFSYHWLFYGNALGELLASILFVYYFKSRMPRHQKKERSVLKSVESPYKNLRMLAFTFLCALYAICFFQLLNTLPLYYKTEHQLTEFQIGVILGYSGLFIVLFEMLIVQIAGKVMSISQIIILGTLLCGLAFVVLNLSFTHVMLYIGISILCVSEILAMPYMSTVYVQESSEHNRGAYMGMYSLAFSVAHIFSPYLGTFIVEKQSFEVLWYLTGLASLGIAFGFYMLMKKRVSAH